MSVMLGHNYTDAACRPLLVALESDSLGRQSLAKVGPGQFSHVVSQSGVQQYRAYGSGQKSGAIEAVCFT